MSCITKGNVRCTKCCEAIHIPKRVWLKRVAYTYESLKKADYCSPEIRQIWTPISKRRAKKINPYIFSKWNHVKHDKEYREEWYLSNKKFIAKSQFFKCKALKKGVGCTIRDTEMHPKVCKVYTGGTDYSYTCPSDINIIARSG